MTSKLYISEIIKYFVFLFFQILVLKVLPIDYYGTIVIVPLFILMLPLSISTTGLLIIAFITGIILDIIEFHPGLYTSSLLVVAFIKHFWFKLLQPPFDEEREVSPAENSLSWLVLYIAVPILLFEITYSIELKMGFSPDIFGFILIRALFDFIFSILFLYLLYK